MSMVGHVFISHASEDRDEADSLCAYIEASGVKAWIAPRDVRPGLDYSEALQSAIEGCFAFVVLVTEQANTSPYVRAESEMAFSNSKPILPVRVTDIQPAPGLAFFLKIRHWTDAYGKNRDANLERLGLELRALAGGTAVVGPPIPPPIPMPPPAIEALPERAPAAAPHRLLPWAILAVVVVGVLIFGILKLTASRGPEPDPNGQGNGSVAQERGFADELADFGARPKSELEPNVGSATPLTIPVGQRVTTGEVQRMIVENPAPLLVDVLANPHPQTLQGALYMPAGGMAGSFSDGNQAQFAQQLAQASGGDQTRPIVFFCQGANCWESYNAALRASAAGYSRIYWYRGGLAAWAAAGLPMGPLPAPTAQGTDSYTQ